MRTLILGAGAVGGYFGGRMLAAGRDVTFLVRPQRAELLRQQGLKIASSFGNVSLFNVPTVTADQVSGPFDLLIVTCKSYDLDSAMEALSPAIGPETVVIPLLNGLQHLDRLATRFPTATVTGGACFISTRQEQDGLIRHLSDVHILSFGPRVPEQLLVCKKVEAELRGGGFDVRLSEDMLQEMWEKWIFIASMAAMTCLMRGTIGDIIAAGGADLARGLLDECSRIATAAGHRPSDQAYDFALERLTLPGSPIAASMLGDIERNSVTEADHVLGALLARKPDAPVPDFSLLRLAQLNLETYRCRRERINLTPQM